MKKPTCLTFLVAALAATTHAADSRVEFRDCPKCDKRIRIDLAAGKAYVNPSRLEGASRDEVAARAARLLDAATIPPARDPKLRPLMGWSSWNTFGVDISETIILETARAMLKDIYPATAEEIELIVPDEHFRRLGQSVAAAQIPVIKKR